jgi:hypothetical protein
VKIDYQGVSVLLAAIVAAIGSLATIIQFWMASKKIDKNKRESITARETQTQTIIASAIAPALATPPPVPPTDVDKP